jgi:hypothetical protein
MKYYIQRQLSEYGPYTLADLQRYVAQGSILLTDLTRSEGMTEWVAVSQVIGNIPPPATAPLIQPVAPVAAASGTVYGGTGTVYDGSSAPAVHGGHVLSGQANALVPPDFHWALVLLVGFFCGIFQVIWLFIEASFVKKIDPESKGVAFLAGSIVAPIIGGIMFAVSASGFTRERDVVPAFFLPFLLIIFSGFVLHMIGVFQMRSSIERYYNTVEPINLRLSGVMTFFFAVFYFQYHFTRIANWKRTGYLQPQ